MLTMSARSVIEERESLNLLKVDAIKRLEIIADIQTKTEKFEEIEELIKEEHDKIRQNANNVATYIQLNIGGDIFIVNKHNILKWEDSLLRYFLCGNFTESTLFLDIDSSNFDRVIQFLNIGYLQLENLSNYSLKILRQNMKSLNLLDETESIDKPTKFDVIQKILKSHDLQELNLISTRWDERVLSSAGKYDNIFRMKTRAEALYQESQSIINLNVGGRLFSTTKNNLLKFKDSYFYRMLYENINYNDSEGYFFIDMIPTNFNRVMNLLRTGYVTFDDLCSFEINILMRNLSFLKLPHPEDFIPFCWEQNNTSLYKLSNSNKTIAIEENDANGKFIFGDKSVNNFSLRLNKIKGTIIIGFVKEVKNDWSFYCVLTDGRVYGQSVNNDVIVSNENVTKYVSGDIISCFYDKIRKCIYFEKNYSNFTMTGFQDVNCDILRPVIGFILNNKDSVVTIIE